MHPDIFSKLRAARFRTGGLNLTDFQGDTVRVLGKGNKERTVYLNQACKAALEQYLPKRITPHEKDKNALFISRNRNRINVQTVKWLVKKHLGQAGLDTQKYSAHSCAITAATLMYQNGVDIRHVAEYLRPYQRQYHNDLYAY